MVFGRVFVHVGSHIQLRDAGKRSRRDDGRHGHENETGDHMHVRTQRYDNIIITYLIKSVIKKVMWTRAHDENK